MAEASSQEVLLPDESALPPPGGYQEKADGGRDFKEETGHPEDTVVAVGPSFIISDSVGDMSSDDYSQDEEEQTGNPDSAKEKKREQDGKNEAGKAQALSQNSAGRVNKLKGKKLSPAQTVKRMWYQTGACTVCGSKAHLRSDCPTSQQQQSAHQKDKRSDSSSGGPHNERKIRPWDDRGRRNSSYQQRAMMSRHNWYNEYGGEMDMAGASTQKILLIRHKNGTPLTEADNSALMTAFNRHVSDSLKKGQDYTKVDAWTYRSFGVEIRVPTELDAAEMKDGMHARGLLCQTEGEFLASRTLYPRIYVGNVVSSSTLGLTKEMMEMLIINERQRMNISSHFELYNMVFGSASFTIELTLDDAAAYIFENEGSLLRLGAFGLVKFTDSRKSSPPSTGPVHGV